MVLIIPFIGTTLGAACVFFMKRELSLNIQMNLNLISYDVYLVYFNRYRGGMARREDCTRGRYGFVGELDSGYYRRSAGWLAFRGDGDLDDGNYREPSHGDGGSYRVVSHRVFA